MGHMRTGLLLGTALSLSFTAPAQSEPNPLGRLSFSQGFTLSDNPDLAVDKPGWTVIATTGLGFTYDASTRVQTFSLSYLTDLEGRFGEGAGPFEDYGVVSERANLSYGRESENSAIALALSLSQVPFEDIEIGEEFDPDALVIDSGTRKSYGFDLDFETGRATRTGVSFGLGYRKTEYVDTSSPDLADNETRYLDGEATFALDGTLVASAKAGIRETDEDGGPDRTTTYIGAGLSGETRGGFSFAGDVTLDSVTTESGGTTTETDGIGFTLNLSQARPLGPYTLGLSRRIDTAGTALSISLGREMALPDGALAWSIGVTDYDNSDPGLTGSLSWSRELKSGAVSASVTRTTRTDDTDAYSDTRLSLDYQTDINDISSLGASLDYFAQENVGGADDSSRTSAEVSYSRSLTRDWRLRAGYTHTRVESAGDPDRDRNSVFLNVERDVTFGF